MPGLRTPLQLPATRLIELRIQHGLSRAQLAKIARISREALRRIETDGVIPQAETQLRIATALEVTPIDLWPLARHGDPQLEPAA